MIFRPSARPSARLFFIVVVVCRWSTFKHTETTQKLQGRFTQPPRTKKEAPHYHPMNRDQKESPINTRNRKQNQKMGPSNKRNGERISSKRTGPIRKMILIIQVTTQQCYYDPQPKTNFQYIAQLFLFRLKIARARCFPGYRSLKLKPKLINQPKPF